MLFSQKAQFGTSSINRCLSVVFLALFTFSVSAQILKEIPQPTWAYQWTAQTVAHHVDTLSVGNYPLLDTKGSLLHKYFKTVSEESAGTLFLVVRPKSDTLPSERLLKLGAISLYKDSIKVDNHSIELNPIEGDPIIAKVKFQARPRRSWFSKNYNMHSSIDIAEMIFYEAQLDDEQIRRVETYLALKYSIKIDQICSKKQPEYLDLSGNGLWNYKVDGLYNEQIMGLGRMDRANFFQSQSFSSDSKQLQIALDTLMTLGINPPVSIQDSSLMIVSKGSDKLGGQCGGNPVDYLFKIKLFDWVSSASTLLIQMDTLLNYPNVVVSDGMNSVPVTYTTLGNSTTLSVPLATLNDFTNYFLVGMSSPDTCNPLYNVAFRYCDSAGYNGLDLSLDTTALPVDCKIVSLDDGSVFDTLVSQPFVQLSNMEAGHYELLASNQNGLIVHSVFAFNSCPSQYFMYGAAAAGSGSHDFIFSSAQTVPSTFSSGVSGDKKRSPHVTNSSTDLGIGQKASSQNSTDESISIYPNPIPRGGDVYISFSNLDDQQFTIQIMDNKGALLRQENFAPQLKNNKYQFVLNEPGTYLVRVLQSADQYTLQTIVVK